MRSRLRSTGCDRGSSSRSAPASAPAEPVGFVSFPAASISRNESAGSTTGTAAPYRRAVWATRRIISTEPSGRTPSCTAIRSGSLRRAASPQRTESNRSAPPATTRWRATSKRAAKSFQKAMWLSGRTTTISAPGHAVAKLPIVRASTGCPPSSRNCLGMEPPMRRPLPPATMMTPMRSMGVSLLAAKWLRVGDVSCRRWLAAGPAVRNFPVRDAIFRSSSLRWRERRGLSLRRAAAANRAA